MVLLFILSLDMKRSKGGKEKKIEVACLPVMNYDVPNHISILIGQLGSYDTEVHESLLP